MQVQFAGNWHQAFMTRFLKELYLTGFMIGFRARMPEKLGGGWGPDWDAGKGVTILILIELINLSNIKDWVEICIGTRFSLDSSTWILWAVGLAVIAVNHYVLVTRGYGLNYARDGFNNLKKSRKTLLVGSFVALLLATILFTYFSFTTYRRVFRIVSV